MKFKKSILGIVLSALLALSAPAMACDDYTNVAGHYEAQAYTQDYAYDYSTYDMAQAGGAGVINGTVDTYADSSWRAYESGSLFGSLDIDAFAKTKDFGKTSSSIAGASYEGDMLGIGATTGLYGKRDSVEIELGASGYVYQQNYAQEIYYPDGQGISGYNTNSVEFEASASDQDKDRHYAAASERLDVKANTFGMTSVTIDPYGNTRSMSGLTFNTASFDTSDRGRATITGNGYMSGLVQNGCSYAGGTSSFSYRGNGGNSISGQGMSTLNATVKTHGSYTSVSVSGSSSAVVGR